MSFNSPAKHERIERHLMRQRGAGVRTVSSNFGFAFGSTSAPTSNDAIPTRELDERPAKRRKTILSTEVVELVTAAVKGADVSKPKKAGRPRRKLDLERDDRDQAIVAADDSFIAVLGKRRTVKTKNKTSKTPTTIKDVATKSEAKESPVTSGKAAVEIEETQALPPTRRKRRAADTTILEVAQSVEQEMRMIAKKQRVPETSKGRAKSRKQQADIEQEAECENFELVRPNEAAKVPDVKAAKKRGPVRKRKITSEDSSHKNNSKALVGEDVDELAASVAIRRNIEAVLHEDVCSQRPASKNPPRTKKNKRTLEETGRHRISDLEPSTEPSAIPPVIDVVDHVKPEPARRPTSLRSTKTTTRTQRQPLAETNMNTTVQSASPAKLPQHVSKQPTFQEHISLPNTKEAASAPAPKQPLLYAPAKPASKRRKLNIKRDAVETTNQRSGPTECIKADDRDGSEIYDSKQSCLDRALITVASAADQGLENKRQTKSKCEVKEADVGVSTCKTSTAPCVTEPDVGKELQGGCAPDDASDADVDWLFDTQHQQPMIAKPKRGAEMKSRKFKMPEMDLDDLLSNIAVFAQEKRSGTVAARNMRLFAGGEKKGRAAARKKVNV